MQELTREQADLLNAKLIIADLSLQLYQARAEIHQLRQKLQELQKETSE